MRAQAIVDEVVKRATQDGAPPTETHKDGLLNCSHYSGFVDNETAAHVLIGAYYDKYDLIVMLKHLADVMQGKPYEPTLEAQ